MPGIEPQQDPYGLAPANDPMSPPDDEPEAMPMSDAGPNDLTIDDAQHRRAAAARSLAALDAAVAQMDRDRAPPAQSARAALDHIDAPDRYAHHIETGKSAVRQQARLAGQPDAQAEVAANDYQSAIHLAHVDARASDDAVGALVAIKRHGADMQPEDRHKALAGIAPRFADERAIADVEAGDLAAAPFAPQAPKMAAGDLRDRMLAISPDEQQTVLPGLLQRYKGDAARSWAAAALGPDKLDALIAQHGDGWYAALPEDVRVDVAQHIAFLGARGSKRALPTDPAAVATRIVNQPGSDDERRQKALDELNWRVMQADRTRSVAEESAINSATTVIDGLGDAFTSISQIPPTLRRKLPPHAIAALARRARDNLNPFGSMMRREDTGTEPGAETGVFSNDTPPAEFNAPGQKDSQPSGQNAASSPIGAMAASYFDMPSETGANGANAGSDATKDSATSVSGAGSPLAESDANAAPKPTAKSPQPKPGSVPAKTVLHADTPERQAAARAQAREDLKDPVVRALMRLIPDMERVKNGYAQLHGTYDEKITDFSHFPSGNAAAGRYQMQEKEMYLDGQRHLGISSFTPDDQDLILAWELRHYRILENIKSGNFPAANERLSQFWVSIPVRNGKSATGKIIGFNHHGDRAGRTLEEYKQLFDGYYREELEIAQKNSRPTTTKPRAKPRSPVAPRQQPAPAMGNYVLGVKSTLP